MKEKAKKKIELVIFKNNIKTKSNLKVNRDITFGQLILKIPTFTTKNFQLQLYSNDQKSFKVLTSQGFSSILSNYNGQKLNINTQLIDNRKEEHSNKKSQIILNKSRDEVKLQAGANYKLHENEQSNKESVIIDEQNEGTQKSLSHLDIDNRAKINQIEDSQKPDQLLINLILDQFNQLDLRSSSEYRGVICSECKRQIQKIYYACVVCKPKIILCEECEGRQEIFGLKQHQFIDHPFAKMKRFTQQIKSSSIQLQKSNDVEQKCKQIKIKQDQAKVKAIDHINQFINNTLNQLIKQKAKDKDQNKYTYKKQKNNVVMIANDKDQSR